MKNKLFFLAFILIIIFLFKDKFISPDLMVKTKKITEETSPSLKNKTTSGIQEKNNSDIPLLEDSQTSSDDQPINNTRGLCYFVNKDKRNYLTIELALFLAKNRPKKLILPAIHSECLNENDSQFHIVKYDAYSDYTYDYLGRINFKAQKQLELASLDVFLSGDLKNFKDFGFERPDDLINYLSKFGIARQIDKKLIIFNLENISNITVRESSKKYELLPGIKLIGTDETIKLIKEQNAKVISFINKSLVPQVDQTAFLSYLSSDFIPNTLVAPDRVGNILNKELNQKIDKKLPLVVMGTSGADLRPFNVALALLLNGHENVSVVSGGGVGFITNAETPQYLGNVSIVKMADIVKNLRDYIVIDVRAGNFDRKYFISEAFSIPYVGNRQSYQEKIRMMSNFREGKAIPESFNAGQFINKENLVKLDSNKPILIVGESEFDWGAVLVADFLRKEVKNKIVWARDGISMMDLILLTQLESPDSLKKYGLVDSTNSREIKEEINYGEKKGSLIYLKNTHLNNFELYNRRNN